ncbi:CBWD5, partial [Symbiodinium sp. KB8]
FNTSAEKVKALDMAAVVAVLVQRDGYSPTKAAELAEEYRKYLALVGTGLQPVPSKKVDDAWHAHILNTKSYAADTQALFGHFLHHEPANLLLNEQGAEPAHDFEASASGVPGELREFALAALSRLRQLQSFDSTEFPAAVLFQSFEVYKEFPLAAEKKVVALVCI